MYDCRQNVAYCNLHARVLSHIQLFVIPLTVSHQASLSIGFSPSNDTDFFKLIASVNKINSRRSVLSTQEAFF